MPEAPSPKATSALIAHWLDRYRGLNALMEQRPGGPSFWVWTVRHRILGYLLQRYGGQFSAADLMKIPVQHVEPQASSPARDAPSPLGIRSSTGGKLPFRTGSALRSHLDRLRELNMERYTKLEDERREEEREKARYLSQRLIVLSYLAPYTLGNEAILEEERSILFDELPTISGLVRPNYSCMTVEEIIAILSDEAQEPTV